MCNKASSFSSHVSLSLSLSQPTNLSVPACFFQSFPPFNAPIMRAGWVNVWCRTDRRSATKKNCLEEENEGKRKKRKMNWRWSVWSRSMCCVWWVMLGKRLTGALTGETYYNSHICMFQRKRKMFFPNINQLHTGKTENKIRPKQLIKTSIHSLFFSFLIPALN